VTIQSASVVIAAGLCAAGCAEPASVDAGRALYAQHGCAGCHGPAGHGDGPVGDTLAVRPRDFRDVAAFRQGASVDAIARTIASGVQPVHTGAATLDLHHVQQMPGFGHLSEGERRSLALFVIALREQPPKGARP
jgi:high-affinity iron transporter